MTITGRVWRSQLLRIGGSLAILGGLAFLLPAGEVLLEMRRVEPTTWISVLAIFMAVQLFGALKFHLVLRSAGVGLPFRYSVRCYFAALFGNVFLPSIIGGDVISIGLAMRYSSNRPGVALGALVNRLLDFTALAFMTALGTLLLYANLSSESRGVFWSVATSLVALATAVGLAGWFLLRRRYSFRVRRRLSRARAAARAMRRRSGVVVLCLAMGVVIQVILVSLVAWLGRSAGLTLSASVWFFSWPLAKLAALAPISVGGIGAREAAFAAILVPFGIAATRTVAVGLLYEAISISGGLLAGLISWLIARRRGPRIDAGGGEAPNVPPAVDHATQVSTAAPPRLSVRITGSLAIALLSVALAEVSARAAWRVTFGFSSFSGRTDQTVFYPEVAPPECGHEQGRFDHRCPLARRFDDQSRVRGDRSGLAEADQRGNAAAMCGSSVQVYRRTGRCADPGHPPRTDFGRIRRLGSRDPEPARLLQRSVPPDSRRVGATRRRVVP